MIIITYFEPKVKIFGKKNRNFAISDQKLSVRVRLYKKIYRAGRLTTNAKAYIIEQQN